MSGRERLRAELEDARRQAHALADPLADAVWAAAPAPGEWSASECFIHLNLTSRAFVPLLREALAAAPTRDTPQSGPRLIGALLWLAITLRIPVRTTEPFMPAGPAPRPAVLGEFDALQAELLAILGRSDDRTVRRVKVTSPFDARVRYSAQAAFRIIAAHQRLHLHQARRAVRAAAGVAGQ